MNSLLMIDDVVTKGPWVDVRAFGAKGDGVTDDTIKIQDALNSISDGIIFFPCGVYKVSNTLAFKPGHRIIGVSRSGVTIEMTNDTKYLFDYKSSLISSPPDIDAGMAFENFTIKAKYGININQSGDYTTVFCKQAPIKGVSFKSVSFFGKYSASVDGNFHTSVIPTLSELISYGVAVSGAKLFDTVWDNCLFQECGLGCYLDGSDINIFTNSTRFVRNARNVHFFDHDSFGHQNKIINCELLDNARVGGIYLDRSFFTQIEGNYFENYTASATFLITNSDIGTIFHCNRIDDTGQITTPFIDISPCYGFSYRNNRWNPSINLAPFLVRPNIRYDGTHNHRVIFDGNSEFTPKPTDMPGVFARPIEAYLFRYNNYEKFEMVASTTPFVWDATLKAWLTQPNSTNNPTIDMTVKSSIHKIFTMIVMGRRVSSSSGGGYFNVQFVPDDGSMTSSLELGSLGFTSYTMLEKKKIALTIPDDAGLIGKISIAFTTNEIQVESIELVPVY